MYERHLLLNSHSGFRNQTYGYQFLTELKAFVSVMSVSSPPSVVLIFYSIYVELETTQSTLKNFLIISSHFIHLSTLLMFASLEDSALELTLPARPSCNHKHFWVLRLRRCHSNYARGCVPGRTGQLAQVPKLCCCSCNWYKFVNGPRGHEAQRCSCSCWIW